MDNLSGLLSEAAVPIRMKRQRFAVLEASEPPLHSDTSGTGSDESTQSTDTFFDDICGLRALHKPERRVVTAHVLRSFRASHTYGVYEPLKERHG
jgi:hypothetical protein